MMSRDTIGPVLFSTRFPVSPPHAAAYGLVAWDLAISLVLVS
jgi:hypothetical protein